MNIAGLFAGIGGLELGLARSGHNARLLCEIDEQLSISKGPHEHSSVAKKYTVNREPIEMTHYPVHLVQESSQVLSSQRDLDSLNLLDGSHPRMVEVGSVDDRRSLDDRNALDNISKLDNLLDASMHVARIRCNIDDNVSVHLHDQSHVSGARVLGTNAQREGLSSRVRGLGGLNGC